MRATSPRHVRSTCSMDPSKDFWEVLVASLISLRNSASKWRNCSSSMALQSPPRRAAAASDRSPSSTSFTSLASLWMCSCNCLMACHASSARWRSSSFTAGSFCSSAEELSSVEGMRCCPTSSCRSADWVAWSSFSVRTSSTLSSSSINFSRSRMKLWLPSLVASIFLYSISMPNLCCSTSLLVDVAMSTTSARMFDISFRISSCRLTRSSMHLFSSSTCLVCWCK
mmetsp:Transcript_56125/g.133691  ORF Transcript_56125/g.133691 Transcript_56125/m.133691 type:complete len:226 (-) Transcript_56125:4309-4986(-)